MRKLGWVSEFSKEISPRGTRLLKYILRKCNVLNPCSVTILLKCFLTEIERFEVVTVWYKPSKRDLLEFDLYVLTITSDKVTLSIDYEESIIEWERQCNKEITLNHKTGQGLAAIKSLFQEML